MSCVLSLYGTNVSPPSLLFAHSSLPACSAFPFSTYLHSLTRFSTMVTVLIIFEVWCCMFHLISLLYSPQALPVPKPSVSPRTESVSPGSNVAKLQVRFETVVTRTTVWYFHLFLYRIVSAAGAQGVVVPRDKPKNK